MNSFRNLRHLFSLPLLLLTACDPITWMVGGGAIAGTTAIRNQNGVSGALSDTEIQASINKVLFEKDPDIFDRVELSVKHGMVVVIGYMKDEEQRTRAMELVRSVSRDATVFDETKVQQNLPNAKEFALDASITSRIKSAMTFDSNVQSLNYDVTSVMGIVYVCGTAQTKFERDVVLNHARTTPGVERVVAYIRINGSDGVAGSGNASVKSARDSEEISAIESFEDPNMSKQSGNKSSRTTRGGAK